MATPTPKSDYAGRRPQFTIGVMLGLLAVLAPLGYVVGRVSTGYLAGTYLKFFTSGIAAGALGVMIGIPIGLFFGSLRPAAARSAASPSTPQMEQAILDQLRAELVENKSLFEARRGSLTMFARISYIASFWTSIKASGRLFVMSDAALLGTIATAYYWLDQASRLELLAYEAKFAHVGADGAEANATKLINEVRLLDGQIAGALDTAIAAIDAAITVLPKY